MPSDRWYREREALLKSIDAKIKRPDVDESVYDLAESFLLGAVVSGVNEDDIWALAHVIQVACEDACREVEERAKAK